jgi:pimeloyl-ACP methyl ester carboxylesterase/DNA-binding winged helix-turn-helix (wHTH) protein
VKYHFDGFEVDTENREVTRDGQPRPLQPQAFSLLAFLIRHRDRVVPKRELLDALWPDAVVGEGSIQRAVHLARAAIDDDGSRIRTVPKLGYRFTAEIQEVGAAGTQGRSELGTLVPCFVRSQDDVHVAYHVIGEGEHDIVLVPGWAFPMRAFFEHPGLAPLLEALRSLGRVILFDKRGTGLSDRIKELPTLERRIDDLRAVLDATGSRQALIVGFSEGGPLGILYASSFPQRTRGLLLVGSFARWTATAGYEQGWSSDTVNRLRDYIARAWGTGETIRAIVESRASEPETIAWAARTEQEGASPGAALDLLEMNLQIDVRPLLPALSVPVAVLHHASDAVIGVDNGRYLAAHIPGARSIEPEGRDHAFFFEGREHLLEALRWLIHERSQTHEPERFLTTVLVAQASPEVAPVETEHIVERFRGIPAGASIWSFDGPQRAISCGHALARAWAALGKAVRLGVHTAEVVRDGARLEGEAIDVAQAVAESAAPGEVRVTQVVRDLVHGSDLCFERPVELELGRGRTSRTLASVPGR